MSHSEWRFRVRHILEAIERIREYTSGLDLAGFERDRKTVDAVVRNFQVIGEAARHVPDEAQSAYPQIPWSLMIGMRNVLVHRYDTVDVETVWRTVVEDLPMLADPLRQLLGESGTK